MKKGFTLAELLGVIVILGIIMTITVPVVTTQIDNYKNKLCVTQYNNILNAAREYRIDKKITSDKEITLSDLINDGYIKQNIKDPVSKLEISPSLQIKIQKSGKKYKYYIVDKGAIGCSEDLNNIYND